MFNLYENNYEYDNEEGNLDYIPIPPRIPTQDLESTELPERISWQYETVPMAQHMASFPIWFVILYLGYSINSESIILQALNVFASFVLVVFLKQFIGYDLNFNFSSFHHFIEFERIDFSLERDDTVVEMSRWVMVPFAWLTEIALILSNESKSYIGNFTHIPSRSALIIIFVVQVIYIYSCRVGMRAP